MTVDLWMPRIFSASDLQARGARWLSMLARVKDGASIETANAEVERVSIEMEKQFPEVFRERRAHLTTIQEFTVGDMRKPLLIMLAAVGFVLLIACANVANLMLVRATAREGEMAIRTALGAGRGRLIRQLITESLLLSVCGAAAGLGIATLGMHELLSRAPDTLFAVSRASIDATTLVVTMVVAIITGVVFGIIPAMHAGSGDLANALRAGGRGIRARHSANRTKRTIVVAEVALAVTLLTGAGLLLHSFVKLLAVDPGFRPEGVMTMKVLLPRQTYDDASIRRVAQAIEMRAAALPGVTSAAVASHIPLDGTGYGFTFKIRGRAAQRSSDESSSEVRSVTPSFFETMGIPVLQGRSIEASDRPGAEKVFVVNQAFAKQFLPHENPVGQSISMAWGDDSTNEYRRIVGVVGDVHSEGLADAPEPTVYASMAQDPFSSLSILVRTSGDPVSFATPLRNIVRELDRDVPVYSVQTMESRVAGSIGRERFYATLIAIFAAVALVLSAVGLYGVIAYAVSQRMHELGVRVALGASGRRLARMVVGEGLGLTAIGAALGIVASLGASKVLSTLLFGVEPLDLITLTSVVALLAIVATAASWLPARRAAQADPLVAMRGE
jgi:putative ABC transport system permease protein